MRIFVLVVLFVMFLGANILLKPEDSVIRPSDFYVNPLVSAGVWHYRNHEQVDYLILGNSRAKDGLDPSIIQEFLQNTQPNVQVQAISTGGGYFPFYYEFLRSTIREKLPKNVILSLSPRDFNSKESRIYNVSSYLISSYGYKLDRKPYNSFFKQTEKNLTNFFAALFPIFYYETHVKKVLFSRKLESTKWDDNKGLKKYLEFFWGLVPQLNYEFKDFYTQLDIYIEGIQSVFKSRPPAEKAARKDGYQIPQHYTHEEYEDRKQKNEEKWARIKSSGDFEKYRTSSYCDSQVQLEVSQGSYLHKTFQFLKENNINVYIVQLPALWLEGCENNLKFGEQISRYLLQLQKQYPNIVSIIDLNNNFTHAFHSVDIYADLEHIYPKNAHLVSIPVAEKISEYISLRK